MRTTSTQQRATVPPRVPIDPRIRRRQIDVLRTAGRRRLRVVVVALVTVAVAAAAWGATRTPLLDVDRVIVDGAATSGDAAVRAASSVHRGLAMTDVDGAGSARSISRLPWVLRADVSREWPSTVRIRVVERQATAVTSQPGGAFLLVDRTGRVLAPVAAPPANLPLVDGFPPAGGPGTRMVAAAGDALAVAAQLPPGLVPRVASVGPGTTGVEVRLKPRGTVLVGDATAVPDKLRAALTVLGAVDGRTVATLDVRSPSTPVLTRP